MHLDGGNGSVPGASRTLRGGASTSTTSAAVMWPSSARWSMHLDNGEKRNNSARWSLRLDLHRTDGAENRLKLYGTEHASRRCPRRPTLRGGACASDGRTASAISARWSMHLDHSARRTTSTRRSMRLDTVPHETSRCASRTGRRRADRPTTNHSARNAPGIRPSDAGASSDRFDRTARSASIDAEARGKEACTSPFFP